jgi:hypothetical protein
MTVTPAPQTPRTDLTSPPKDQSASIIRWARILLTLALIPFGLSAFRDENGALPIVGDIDTAVHEFGHILFMPFGETMMFLGGSLTQVALPLVFAVYFARGRAHRDIHAASVCVWWCSMNLVHVAVYAADARARELMLLSGATGQDDDSGHDFYNLFSRWGVLQHDTLYANGLRRIAWLLFAASIGVGLWTAFQGNRSPKQASTSRV